MGEPVGVTPAQLESAEQQLRGQVPAAQQLQGKADDDGLDMMAWGVPGLFFSPGYYQMLGELREMFEMLTAGLEGHAGRLKDCRESWETADMDTAKEFSQFSPEGIGGSIQWGGSTFTDGDGNFQMFEIGESKKQSYAKPIFGAMDTVEKIQKVGRAENAGELIGAVADVSNSLLGTLNDVAQAITDPLMFLISAGLDFLISLIQPIDDLVGMVTGNGERMNQEIQRWDPIKDALPPIGEAVAKVPEEMLTAWSGKDGDAAREKIAEFAEAVVDVGDKIQVMQGLLQLTELIATLIRKTLLDIAGKWASQQIITWAAAGPLSAVTFGGAAVAAMINSIRSAIQSIVLAIRRYKTAVDAFLQANTILGRVVATLGKAASPLAEAGIKSVGMVGNLAGSGAPSDSSIVDGLNG
ncbi:hypothetical protein [Glycomyces sp. MUSA5-2]|uniref:hypothetical protein n=1 Tax=Glycomyces sp. MUSA5-2 TaxID=2053002 RepID=UPI003009875C